MLSGVLKLCDKALKQDDDFKSKFENTNSYCIAKSKDYTILIFLIWII